MNIVILKHTNDGRQFVFEVPAGKTLLKDDRVIVKNKNGIVDGICTCDSFEASENVVEAMSDAFRCKLPLAQVAGKYTPELWYDEKAEAEKFERECDELAATYARKIREGRTVIANVPLQLVSRVQAMLDEEA